MAVVHSLTPLLRPRTAVHGIVEVLYLRPANIAKYEIVRFGYKNGKKY